LKQERERPTHIEVLSVCTADAAIQSNPIPVARNPLRIRTYKRIVFLSRVLILFRLASNTISAPARNWWKFRLVTGRNAIFPISNDSRITRLLYKSMIYFEHRFYCLRIFTNYVYLVHRKIISPQFWSNHKIFCHVSCNYIYSVEGNSLYTLTHLLYFLFFMFFINSLKNHFVEVSKNLDKKEGFKWRFEINFVGSSK